MLYRKRALNLFVAVAIISLIAAFFSYEPLWQKVSGARPWSFGLDIAGGSYLTYEIDLSKVESAEKDSVVRGLRDVIERRVNFLGLSEPRVYTETEGTRTRLVVELAGIKDVTRAIQEIGSTPLLDFREVVEHSETGTPTLSATSTAPEFIPTLLTGRYVQGAQISFDSVTNAPQVNISFNEEGARIFEELTEKNIGKPLAIFLDGVEIERPMVQEKISGGKAQITGKFTVETARQLVERFNAGALPAPIMLVNQQTIDADFGKDSLDKAIFAGSLGAFLVIIFMILYYRKLGVFASVALLIYIALTLGIFKLMPVTMTLAGIAGFILSIGMAVDANILVFERTKEELKKGISIEAAIEEGFRRAWTSIRDSNISTLITSVVLYYFTSSFVRGFALTLFIGVLISMFSAITVTRSMLRVFYKKQ